MAEVPGSPRGLIHSFRDGYTERSVTHVHGDTNLDLRDLAVEAPCRALLLYTAEGIRAKGIAEGS